MAKGMKPKSLFREDIERAMRNTKSNRAAARYLNVSFECYKRYAKLYNTPDGVMTLYELHKNQHGWGIPKHLKNHTLHDHNLDDVLSGRINSAHFAPQKIKKRMIEEGILAEKCYNCGFQERRVIDYKIPLLLHFLNGNATQFGDGNCQLLCYNCYFLFGMDVFTVKDIESLESLQPKNSTTPAIEFELDDYQKKQLELLMTKGRTNTFDNDDAYSLVSRK